MVTRGRPKVPLILTEEERRALQDWAGRPHSCLAFRSRVVLACADGLDNKVVAANLLTTQQTVSKWRTRFLAKRLDGLADDPRPGAARTVTDDLVEAVIKKTLEEKPTDAPHWSTRSMAKAMGMSQSAISRIWRAFGLTPITASSSSHSATDGHR